MFTAWFKLGFFNKTVYDSIGEKVNHLSQHNTTQHNTNTAILFQRHWLQIASMM